MPDFVIGLATVLISAGITYLIVRRFTAQDVATEADRAARESSRADVAWDRADRRSERLNALLEATDDAILRVGSDLVIRAASPVTGEILARGDVQFRGMPLIEATVDFRLEELTRKAIAGEVHRGEIDIRDGRLGHSDEARHVSVVAAPDGDGGAWLVLRDLTEVRRLRQIRTEFVDNLSHELRTPLSTIRLLAETIGGAAAKGDVSGVASRSAKIEVEVLHLVQMADEMLDLATLEAGEIPLRKAEFDLVALAEEVAQRFTPVAAQHGGGIDVIGTGPILITGDRDRLRQAVANLVHNAVKYSREGGRVELQIDRLSDSGSQIAVIDHGIGIDRAHLSRIFERFFTVERVDGGAGAVGGGGTGLGLAIARHAVLRHGGEITVTSAAGVGTTFTMTLPAAGAAS
ncbi:MAG: ATP-binding protein [Chloroflexi bacterium]|nr:ATP-binding protein [Chloroflexota bacterium]